MADGTSNPFTAEIYAQSNEFTIEIYGSGLGPWGPGPGDDTPVRSMFDASHRRRRKRPDDEPLPPALEQTAPERPADLPYALPPEQPYTVPLADLMGLETRLALTQKRIELAERRKQDEEAATLALWWMMQED